MPEFIDRQLNTLTPPVPFGICRVFNPDAGKRWASQPPLVPKQIHNLGSPTPRRVSDKYHKTFAERVTSNGDEALGLWGIWQPSSNSFGLLPFTIRCRTPEKVSSATRSYGGRKGMVGWTLINFPTARAPTHELG